MQLAERGLNLLGCAALLVDSEDALLEIHSGLDGPKYLVGGAEDSVEEAELLGEEFENAAVGIVALVQEVDDHYVVLLAVTVTAADTLLNALWVPG